MALVREGLYSSIALTLFDFYGMSLIRWVLLTGKLGF